VGMRVVVVVRRVGWRVQLKWARLDGGWLALVCVCNPIFAVAGILWPLWRSVSVRTGLSCFTGVQLCCSGLVASQRPPNETLALCVLSS